MKISGTLIKVINTTDLFCNEGLSFVQAPKLLNIGDKILVFFSSRKILPSGYPESNIYSAELSYDFDIVKITPTPILGIGELGEFNEHGNAYFSPFLYKNSVYGFFSGLSRKESSGIETAIGISVSDFSCKNFKKLGPGPLISASLFQPMLIGNPFVFHYNSKYYMFYIYGEQWVKNGEKDGGHARVYKIGLKTGKSFLNLSRTYNNLISNVLGDFECQATPNVFFSNGLFHMVFCYRSHNDFRDNAKNSYRIGYAFSTDLLTWVRNDEILTLNSFGAWDSNMHCYPSVFNLKDKWYLMYNGNQFGKFSFGIFELNIQSFS